MRVVQALTERVFPALHVITLVAGCAHEGAAIPKQIAAEPALQEQEFLQAVRAGLRERFVVPIRVANRECVPEPVLVIYIEEDGRIARWAYEVHAEDPALEAALDDAVRSSRFPAPPASLRDRLRKEGLGIAIHTPCSREPDGPRM